MSSIRCTFLIVYNYLDCVVSETGSLLGEGL